ncbi:unnamed protein product [Brachionus calyciflorus]|uniref:J domain-containing protein n=1 Tax=Brachionus calyciflorus TaxID=104777 RepID=A0A813STC8_9BILA|nr:unnamed protein product [Brachionus calyciflorus]
MSETIKNKLLETDLYKIFDVEEDSPIEQIKKAYRKKALELHPDKNPDNKEEAERKFIELGKAFEILADKTARAAYDAVRRQKREKAKRDQQLDEKRRKLKEDLERREAEAAAKYEKKTEIYKKSKEEEWLQKEVDRLRKEGSKLLEEEMNFINQQIRLEKKRTSESETKQTKSNKQQAVPKIKITWSKEKASDKIKLDENLLNHIFSSYGDIEFIVMGKKSSAILEYKNEQSVIKCYNDEANLNDKYGLVIKIIGELSPTVKNKETSPQKNQESVVDDLANFDSTKSFEDMEMEILKKLKAASS